MAEIVYNDPDDIESADDVKFPNHVHHFKVRSELSELVKEGAIGVDDADTVYEDWINGRK